MTDSKDMKVKFKDSLIFGWKEVIIVMAFLITCSGVYYGMQHSIEDSAHKIEEVSTRLAFRANLVDGNFDKINSSVNDLKVSVAVLQNNQSIISKQISDLQKIILEQNHKAALYRTAERD